MPLEYPAIVQTWADRINDPEAPPETGDLATIGANFINSLKGVVEEVQQVTAGPLLVNIRKFYRETDGADWTRAFQQASDEVPAYSTVMVPTDSNYGMSSMVNWDRGEVSLMSLGSPRGIIFYPLANMDAFFHFTSLPFGRLNFCAYSNLQFFCVSGPYRTNYAVRFGSAHGLYAARIVAHGPAEACALVTTDTYRTDPAVDANGWSSEAFVLEMMVANALPIGETAYRPKGTVHIKASAGYLSDGRVLNCYGEGLTEDGVVIQDAHRLTVRGGHFANNTTPFRSAVHISNPGNTDAPNAAWGEHVVDDVYFENHSAEIHPENAAVIIDADTPTAGRFIDGCYVHNIKVHPDGRKAIRFLNSSPNAYQNKDNMFVAPLSSPTRYTGAVDVGANVWGAQVRIYGPHTNATVTDAGIWTNFNGQLKWASGSHARPAANTFPPGTIFKNTSRTPVEHYLFDRDGAVVDVNAGRAVKVVGQRITWANLNGAGGRPGIWVTPPENCFVLRATVGVETAFNGTTPTLSIGWTADPDALFQAQDLSAGGVYSMTRGVTEGRIGTTAQLVQVFGAHGATAPTAGVAYVVLEYVYAPDAGPA